MPGGMGAEMASGSPMEDQERFQLMHGPYAE